jgi:hypothetical protein
LIETLLPGFCLKDFAKVLVDGRVVVDHQNPKVLIIDILGHFFLSPRADGIAVVIDDLTPECLVSDQP